MQLGVNFILTVNRRLAAPLLLSRGRWRRLVSTETFSVDRRCYVEAKPVNVTEFKVALSLYSEGQQVGKFWTLIF